MTSLTPAPARIELAPSAAVALLLRTRTGPVPVPVPMRIAACEALAGCTGRRAVEALVAALDDGALRVRQAATSSLGATATAAGHGWRLAHAALHRRADVRAGALGQPALLPDLLLELLGDDVVGPLARATAQARMANTPALVGAVLLGRRRGVIDDDTARDLVGHASWTTDAASLVRQVPAAPGMPSSTPPAAPAPAPILSDVDALERAMGQTSDDTLIDLLRLIAVDGVLSHHVVAGIAAALRRRLLDVDDRVRIAVAVAVVAATGPVPAVTLALGVCCAPAILGLDAIDHGARRAACLAAPALGVPARDGDPFAAAKRGGLLPNLAAPPADVVTAATADTVEVIAALASLSHEHGWTRALAAIPVAALATSQACSPQPLLWSLPPGGGAERAAWAALLRLVGVNLQQLPWDEPLDHGAWLRTLCVLPADGLVIIADLVAARPDIAPRLLALAVDGAAPRGTALDDTDWEHRSRRRERAFDALVDRCGPATRAGLVRVATDTLAKHAHSDDPARQPGAWEVVASFCRTTPLPELAALIDVIDARHRQYAVDIALQVAPPLWTTEGLGAALRHPTSTTLVALARRDAPPEPLDDTTIGTVITARPWPAFADDVLRLASTGRRRGVADVVIARADHGDAPPRTAALAAAVLASHDPPWRAARALALCWPPDDATAAGAEGAVAAILQRHVPTSLLPHLATALVDRATFDRAVAPGLVDSPGGLRGQMELGLNVDGPWARLWLDAVVGHLERAATLTPDTLRLLRADRRLRTLIDDVGRGELLTGDDPRRRPLARLAALTAPPVAVVPSTPTRPWPAAVEDALATLATATTPMGASAIRVDHDDDETLSALLHDALIVGGFDASTLQLVARLLPSEHREGVVREALRVGTAPEALASWLRLLPLSSSTSDLDPLRATLAWGARQGLALCGTTFQISLITDGLGHTRLGRRRIFVNPLPLVRGERDGDAIVRGLILHELGHHRHHGGDEGRAVWEQARTERLHQLLNLVADEHLERNLRALSPRRYGEPLKTLAAWAFQHMHREMPWTQLLKSLGPRARAVLTTQQHGPGRRPDSVVVDVGTALGQLARQGSSFARFMRTLRMGRTDGSGDERVREAMALFPAHRFRTSTMPELIMIARRLRAIFGDETALLDAFDFHQLTDASADELSAGGVDREAIEREPVAAPRPRLRGRPGRGAGLPTGRGINVDDDVSFEEIKTVERLTPDIAHHRQVAALVRRPATELRRHLLRLGSGTIVERRRLSGRRLDRSALVANVLKGDPRLLSSKRPGPSPDVFVGVAIDCSGSMDGENLERATSFAVLLAEAVRGLPDVEARFFGFTDDTIYDAGDARRCAVTSLQANGGNNDAAALAHVARVARTSRRSTMLLVMLSDGAPTECSVDALRALVTSLEARGMLCAQVAVEAIDDDDICFQRHILLDDGDLAGAARRFGAVIEDLLDAARTHRPARPARAVRAVRRSPP